ncbi:hypothetical protein TorRG33x02_321060 [Trema orientale]|uniref:Uncharacterized protein n=1 Tax=Trema orientale TaxID=63057 RepID=A0A2P5BHA5_TREOI|nr:hypothetical protein TorRG33x02_321060 [Trema orientale]
MEKSKGGMGFQDIEIFNQVMLAKLAWRICQNQESLVSKILKHKYFRTKDFLDVNLGTNCSAAWRGIIWGRDGLKVGLRWKVGSGQSLQVFNDP